MSARFTPTEQRILNTLSDGQPHTVASLRECLDDELGTNIMIHISRMRPKLRSKGGTIVYIMDRKIGYYQLRQMVGSSSE